MNAAQIKHMVDRFLGWKLPKDFAPDCGISYAHIPGSAPVGTNLFSFVQATDMVVAMLEGLPDLGEAKSDDALTEELDQLITIEPLVQVFRFAHLPPHLRGVSRPFAELAVKLLELPRNPERSVALRKLREAKDCAVTAMLWKA